MTGERSVLASGYVPLDIVRFNGDEWRAAGGTAGNVSSILAFLGWSSKLAADIGDDPAGQALIEDLAAAGVDTSHIRTREFDTPRIVHEIGPKGHGYRFSCPACGRRFARTRPLKRDRAEEILAEVDVPDVYFFDRINAGTIELARWFAARGSFIVVEPSGSLGGRYADEVLALAHLIKTADDRDAESRTVMPVGRPRQIRVVTHGVDGASFRVGRSKWRCSPGFSYPTVDAGGAGDWTTAGLLHAIENLSRPSVETVGNALRWGQALAAVSCGVPGARGLAGRTTKKALRAVDPINGDPRQLLMAVKPFTRQTRRAARNALVECSSCLWAVRDRARSLTGLGSSA